MSETERCFQASATLIVWASDFNPQEITCLLELQPCQSWRQGERKSFALEDGSMRQFDSVAEWSGWKLWLDEDWRCRPLVEQVRHWIEDLLPSRAEKLLSLREQGARIELNCFVVSANSMELQLPAAWLSLLGGAGVDLEIRYLIDR